ncbi:MAG: PRC-barrel domain-containing protein [Candidatus Thermoplasmatota archaeon]|jgi:sporulation protein YlmC with PRC-barrel domain
MKVFESELRGKTVMSNEGGYLGILRNVSANVSTGDLVAIHVEPAEEVNAKNFPQDSQGRLQFPFTAIKAVRDVVVVSTN